MISTKAKVGFYATVVALLASVTFGFHSPKPVNIGDALKIRPAHSVQIADAYKVTR